MKTLFKKPQQTELPEKITPLRLLLFSLISSVFFIYPNIAFFSMEREHLEEAKGTVHLLFFIFRYLYFAGLTWLLISANLKNLKTPHIRKRLVYSAIITVVAYLVYIGFSVILSPKQEWFTGLLLFQFFVIFIFSMLAGHLSFLLTEQRRKEHEIEQLKIENLESRYSALTNQINPHFFFNSLNGLTSLIRKKNDELTLEYVNKLSDVFRYILQSDRKVMVTLADELDFLKAFGYMMEVRFARKLVFIADVPDDKRDLKIPVLSLLPLLENLVLHNTIDSEHKMELRIWLNDACELVISNPIYPKLVPPETNGTGLKNLESRFWLLLDRKIRIDNDGKTFTVSLPLK
ncbi:MAG: histidine kinase [Bacteroidales bacterium]|nr:histidine kinase [Bacteroidales bacterium]